MKHNETPSRDPDLYDGHAGYLDELRKELAAGAMAGLVRNHPQLSRGAWRFVGTLHSLLAAGAALLAGYLAYAAVGRSLMGLIAGFIAGFGAALLFFVATGWWAGRNRGEPLARKRRGGLISGEYYLLLFPLLLINPGRQLWAVALAAFGVAALFGLIGAWRRHRLTEDTATSKIAAAPQGYRELAGVAEPGALPLRDPVAEEVCVWFRVESWWTREGSRVLVKSAESSRPFQLRDASGVCEVLPEGAELSAAEESRVVEGSELVHVITRIRAGQRLYVLGDFQLAGHTPQEQAATRERAVAEHYESLCRTWESDPAATARFDRDGDGWINTGEQKALQAQALRAARALADKGPDEIIRVIAAPADGRPFLISRLSANSIGGRYRWLMGLHALFTLLGLAAALGLLLNR